ncbi:MAG TPA: hypothetical protein VFM09_13055 [Marmoricola sp.]|nr:hypothetical protein [Marmoricola sp.]
MSADIAAATIRLTVIGDPGRADLAVPRWCDLGTVASSWAHAVGAAVPGALLTVAGAPLDPTLPVDRLGLHDGDLVVAVPATADVSAQPAPGSTTPQGASRARRSWGGPVAGAVALSGLTAGALGAGEGTVTAVVAALLGTAVVAAVLGHRRQPWSDAALLAVPALGAGLGLVLTRGGGPVPAVLGVLVAALAAGGGAALARMPADDALTDVLDACLVAAGLAAATATVVLLTGGSTVSLAALGYGGAVVAVRLLPGAVVDVPDTALLDLDRLAVTAWTAREPRRSGRRRFAVRREGVEEVVRRGHRVLATGTLVAAAVVAVAGPVLVVHAGEGPAGIGALAMVGLGAAGLALMGRSFRRAGLRAILRAVAVGVVGVEATVLLTRATPPAAWSTFGAAAGTAVLVLVAAVALGQGWRSIWWARTADVVESIAVALAVAALPLACGLFEAVRQLVS